MAYCPKCGVELERYIENCPLCEFPIPNIGDPHYFFEDDATKKYPHAINIYKKDHMVIKNKIFFSFIVVVISAIIILAVLKLIYPSSVIIANYALIGFIGILFYMFFSFGYLKPFFNLLGLTLTTLFITFAIDYQSKSEWFIHYAMPIILILYADITVFLLLSKMSRNKNKFVYVPTVSLLFLSILTMGIDGVLSMNLKGSFHLSWSLIVLICSGAIAGMFLGIYHGIPEKSKTWLKRKLHV